MRESSQYDDWKKGCKVFASRATYLSPFPPGLHTNAAILIQVEQVFFTLNLISPLSDITKRRKIRWNVLEQQIGIFPISGG